MGPTDRKTSEPREPRDDDLAAAILETVPVAMRAIRSRMREGRPAGISVPQFRALLYVRRHPGTGLSDMAEHLGTSVPAASELVTRLIRLDLVERVTDPQERRRVQLTLSPTGVAQLDEAEAQVTTWLRHLVDGLDPERGRALVAALADLDALIGSDAARVGTPPASG